MEVIAWLKLSPRALTHWANPEGCVWVMTEKRSERADKDWRIAYMPVGGDGAGVEQV